METLGIPTGYNRKYVGINTLLSKTAAKGNGRILLKEKGSPKTITLEIMQMSNGLQVYEARGSFGVKRVSSGNGQGTHSSSQKAWESLLKSIKPFVE